MKNLSKFAFVALTALAVSFSSCKSETKTEGEGTTTEATEGTDAMSTDSAATDAMTTDSAATTTTTDSAAAQ